MGPPFTAGGCRDVSPTVGDTHPHGRKRPVASARGRVGSVNSSVIRSLPVKFVGALIALVVAGIALYVVSVLSMYMIAWSVWIVQTIFG